MSDSDDPRDEIFDYEELEPEGQEKAPSNPPSIHEGKGANSSTDAILVLPEDEGPGGAENGWVIDDSGDDDESRAEEDEVSPAEDNRSPFTVILFAGLAALLAIYIVSLVASVLADIARLPFWLSVPILGLFLFLFAFVVFAFLVLAFRYIRLRRVRKFDLKTLREFHHSSNCAPHDQRLWLENYLVEYREKLREKRPLLLSVLVGQQQDFKDRICSSIDRLLEDDSELSDRDWLENFHKEFQSVVDEAAEEYIKSCAKYAGVKTAVSPNALVDVLVTLYWSYRMVGGLFLLYQVRPSFFGVLSILWRSFLNAYISGKIQELEGKTEDTLEDAVKNALGIGDGIANQIVTKISVKAASGYINYLLIRRLGKQAIRQLQPLADHASIAR